MISFGVLTVALLAAAPAAPVQPPETREGVAAPASPAASAAEATTADAAERAAVAAERAAAAAEKAAEAAARVAASVPASAPAPTAAPGAPAAPAATEAAPGVELPAGAVWSGTASVGLISLTGNSRAFTTNGAAKAERRSESWIWAAAATGTYGQSRTAGTAGEPEVLAMAASAQLRGDRRFTERYSGYLLGGADTDHVKSIEARSFGEAGLGIIWIDQLEGDFSKHRLSTDVAFRLGRELRFQYYPVPVDREDEPIVAPKFGVQYRYAINEFVIFEEEAEVLPTVYGESRVLVNSNTKLTARVVEAVGIGVGFQVKHDSRPAPEKLPTDTALTFSLEAGF